MILAPIHRYSIRRYVSSATVKHIFEALISNTLFELKAQNANPFGIDPGRHNKATVAAEVRQPVGRHGVDDLPRELDHQVMLVVRPAKPAAHLRRHALHALAAESLGSALRHDRREMAMGMEDKAY